MLTCPSCARVIPEDASFCSACGAALSLTSTPTKAPPELPQVASAKSGNLAHKPAPGGLPSSGALDQARFVPGMILAERYRILGLLGQGGMGEVYKAEDLKLHQTVALKFLPEAIALDGAMLARFHNEVRIARQVSHPSVCRVYDIGEVEGRHFLSMEFIDGEDLSSLLRRIGRLPGDKAVEIARQICAGLAAAHEMGVLHRDLKPANVMIDGRGKARITDFGLAVVSEELRGDEVLAGTPAYMAPEQLTGKEATPRSDIYALGLVLYELFTGKRVFEAKSLHELMQLHQKSTPPTPSSHVKDIDPLAERVILRCLEKDPKARPTSAVQVALALPGGDPLQAALVMGETPSPEMVAASGEKAGLRPVVAVACLATIVVGLFLSVWLGSKVNLIERVPLDPSDALARKAREISARLGYPDQPVDSAWSFNYETAYLNYVVKNDLSPTRWNHLQFPVVTFGYSEGPTYLPVVRDLWNFRIAQMPPMSGMIYLTLDPRGRLLRFRADPPVAIESRTIPVDWAALFREAGLDPARFTQVEPQWTPPSAFDAHAAWTGTDTLSAIPLRIEAAAWHGKPVFFRIIYPWTPTPTGRSRYTLLPDQPTFIAILVIILLLGAALIARSNYRRGKGDRQGAFKFSCLVFGLYLLTNLLFFHHIPTLSSMGSNLLREFSVALYWAATTWLFYFAFEPFVRRYWPASIISWSRLLAGRVRDALLGRDVLIGVLAGIVLFLLPRLLDYWIGYREADLSILWPLNGVRWVAGTFFASLLVPLFLPVTLHFLLFLLRVLLRRQWLAVSVMILLCAAVFGAGELSYQPLISLPALVLIQTIMVILIIRFGLVALSAAWFAISFLQGFPLTLNFSAWYAGIGMIGPLAVLAMAIYGFHTSLGGQKVFAGKLLEE